MQTPAAFRQFRPTVLVTLLAVTIAACGGSAAPAPATPQPATPAPTQPGGPGGGTGGGSDGGSGDGSGSAPGNPGTGVVDPGVPGGNPGEEPQLVNPVPGAIQVRDANASALSAAVNGRRVAVKVAFWGGVEPCHVLAGVNVARDGNTFTLTVKTGAGPNAQDVACIEIAVLKAAIVDLGELAPGSYTIRAIGDAPPIEVVVS